MAINKKCIAKFEEAYRGIPESIIPFVFLPSSPYYHIEEWREVLPRFVPGVRPNTYWVSNHGRVYSNIKSPNYPNGGIMAHSINQRGYHQINLMGVDGKKIGIKISRLVMLHFRFIPGCHLLEVDHLDGNKDNNVLWNFEWIDPLENTHRAFENGLRSTSSNSNPRTTYCRDYINNYYNNNYNDAFLEDTFARQLFHEYVISRKDIDSLAQKYNVSHQYIEDLARGVIRPYIYKEYISNKLHKRISKGKI